MERADLSISMGSSRIAASVFTPDGPGPHPVVVMGNGFALTRDVGLPQYAERFAAAGMAALTIDYRGFGESGGTPRQELSVKRQMEDLRAAVAYVHGHPDFAAVAVWGYSFGGGHACALAAEDLPIRAAVALCPFADGLRLFPKIPATVSLLLTLTGLVDRARQFVGRPPLTLPAIGEEGSLAVITLPGVVAGLRKAHPRIESFDNRVSAGIALTIPGHRPGRRARRARVPLLVSVAEQDTIAPAPLTHRAVSGGSNVTVESYQAGHFDVFDGPDFERVVTDQINFLLPQLRS